MDKQYQLFDSLSKQLAATAGELDGESKDRARILLSAALLEEVLTTTLTNFLADCSETRKLLNPMTNGAISQFGAKIDMCVALGLLPVDEAKRCRELASMRNVFAHKVNAQLDEKQIALLTAMEDARSYPFPPGLSLGMRYQNACSYLLQWIVLRWSEDRLNEKRLVHPPQP
ncbi:hypothetical protein [Rhizobium sp. CECT 9324]|uniref:hypothetical protein n=1 Tax=Rhizobium sp. CECT 9324 TaxID=2845820 RepID=UPI001E554ED3|nr:hypothetical protein [Rhizobium sp. CECT 9324]CAH0339558.1 hypothetical protein RHI9324_01209 [Rhizobium sp. CECT 9324]